MPPRSHGHCSKTGITPEYRAWQNMKGRCTNPNVPEFRKYGARGISVCQEWLASFETFLRDMGPRPSPRHSLDRIDNNGNYEPGNCRWATTHQQHRNTRRNRQITFNGKTMCLKDWAKELGMSAMSLHLRLKGGMSVTQALTYQKRQGKKQI